MLLFIVPDKVGYYKKKWLTFLVRAFAEAIFSNTDCMETISL
jgi:hypothetical protein